MTDKEIILEILTQSELKGTYVDAQSYVGEHKDLRRIVQKLFDFPGFTQI